MKNNFQKNRQKPMKLERTNKFMLLDHDKKNNDYKGMNIQFTTYFDRQRSLCC